MPNESPHRIAIALGRLGHDTQVILDGVEISGALRGIEVRAEVGELSRVTLGRGSARDSPRSMHRGDHRAPGCGHRGAIKIQIARRGRGPHRRPNA